MISLTFLEAFFASKQSFTEKMNKAISKACTIMEERREKDNSGLAMKFYCSLSIGHVSYRFTEHYQLTTNKYLETITDRNRK